MKRYLERIYGDSRDNYYSLLRDDIKNGNKRFIITVNPEILVMSRNDKQIEEMLLSEDASLVPDGIAVVKACKMLNIGVTERIAGVETAEFLFKELNEQKKSLYLFGAKANVIKLLVDKIGVDYPNIQLLGYTDGYIDDKDGVFEKIAYLKPDVCMVALGVPGQEKLIYRHLHKFERGLFIGVGGSFDVLSGTKSRAPKFFLKYNIEWLYRIVKEPKRLKRFYNNNIKFLFTVKKQSK